MSRFAYERAASGQGMPGVLEVPWELPIGQAIEEILLIAESSDEGEWEGMVIYLPL